jgi:ribosomal protein S3
MAKPVRPDTYLVAVKQKREPTRVYALMARSPAEALQIVSVQASEGVAVEVAGKLSKRMARPYKLKLGDLTLI